MARRIGMMQPYLFPYLGYFQVISAVDTFVLGDDLQYMKQGWVNRNKILFNGEARLISFPLKKANHQLKINERTLSDNFSAEADEILKMIFIAYAKAPCFENVFPFIENIIRYPERNLAMYAENSIKEICDYLDIRTPILISSELALETGLRKQERVIATVKKLNGGVYINPIGGVDLYRFEEFREHGIELKFHVINDIRYRQYKNNFVPFLSIIDVLMFNEISEVKERISCYSLRDRFDDFP